MIMEMIVDRLACLTIMASAIEVFPKECIGLVFGKAGNGVLAVPIQVARRRNESVTTISDLLSDKFETFLGFKRLCGYHSHTFTARERDDDVRPSDTDMKGIDVGEIEVIVNIRKRRRTSNSIAAVDGCILMSFAGYDLKMSAFERIEGKDKNGPLNRQVSLSLGK